MYDISNKIKGGIFHAVAVSILPYGGTDYTQTKCFEKKLKECCVLFRKKRRSNGSQNNSWTAICLPSHKPFT